MSGTNGQYQELPVNADTFWSRLLTLHPGGEGDPIACSLTASTIEETTRYEALSYVWGTSTETLPIKVNLDRGWPVTVNLYKALKRLRLSDRARVLWVDAICINQTNLAEKGKQVSRMDTIFSHAQNVLIWLGDCDIYQPELLIAGQRLFQRREDDLWTTTAQDAFFCARQEALDEAAQPGWNRRARRPGRGSIRPRPPKPPACVSSPETRQLGSAMSAGPPPVRKLSKAEALKFAEGLELLPAASCSPPIPEVLSDRFGQHILQSITIPSSDGRSERNLWWKRVWIIQELLLAKVAIVYCGPYELSWEACQIVLRRGSHLSLLDGLRRSHVSGELGLLDLLRATVFNSASDPRDNVFGVMHLTQGRHKYYTQPDYEVSPRSVFAEAALHCIMTTGEFDILFHPFQRFVADTVGSGCLHSWIPDLAQVTSQTKSDQYLTDWYDKPEHGRWYATVTFKKQNFLENSNPPSAYAEKPNVRMTSGLRLELTAYHVDEVVLTYQLGTEHIMTDPYTPCENHAEHYTFIERNVDPTMVAASATCCWREWSFVEAMYAAVRGIYGSWSPFPFDGLHRSEFVSIVNKVAMRTLTLEQGQWAWTDFARYGHFAQPFLKEISHALHSNDSQWKGHFFVTGNGLVGFGPANVQSGDLVVEVLGAGVPWVLRPVGDEYVLVGDAYVHGLMAGAMSMKVQRGECEPQEFVLL